MSEKPIIDSGNGTVTLDVRDDIRHGREPFSRIMNAVRKCRPGQKFLLIAPFKPAPLFGVLNKRGFTHDARQIENGDWEVLFTRTGDERERTDSSLPIEAKLEKSDSGGRSPKEIQFIEVDARGLEPPQPMVKILEALAGLPEGAGLRAHTDRRPMHLYAEIEARGFIGKSEEQKDGSFITHIHRS